MSYKNLRNRDLIDKLYQKPKKEIDTPSYNILAPDVFHEIDVLSLPNDDGTGHLLTIIDVHNSLVDARPIRSMTMNNIIHALDDIYENSQYLSYPHTIQGDSQFDNTEFRRWCDKRQIALKITVAYRHRQNAHVERLNQAIGKAVWLYQIDKEIDTGKNFTKWKSIIKEIIEDLNNARKKRLNKNYQKKNEPDDSIKLNKNNSTLLERGTKVRLMLDQPETLHGNKIFGKFRQTDHRWKYQPQYEVVENFINMGSPPLYKIKNLRTNKIVDAFYTKEQLQVV